MPWLQRLLNSQVLSSLCCYYVFDRLWGVAGWSDCFLVAGRLLGVTAADVAHCMLLVSVTDRCVVAAVVVSVAAAPVW